MILLVYKEAYSSTNNHDSIALSMLVSLLYEYDDIFPRYIPSGLLPISGIEH